MKNLNSWYIIINPVSGNKFYQKKRSKLTKALSQLASGYKIAVTSYSGQEEELVETAINIGYRKFICAGGDGTVHHVINGIMKYGREFKSQIKVGVIPIGTGNDWAKQYQIPNEISKCIEILNKEETMLQDIGKISSKNSETYFNNLAGIGFDGHIINQINSFKIFGSLAYFLAALKSLFTYKKQSITYTFEVQSDTANSYLLGIGVCRYCGGGMQLTHNPNPADSLFDITVVKDISAIGFVWNIRKMFNQKLHLHPKVDTFKCTEISIESINNSTILMQADGELIPFDSMTVSIVPNAIQVIVLESNQTFTC